MLNTMENGFTGFYIRPKCQIINGVEVPKCVEIELLKDGEVVKIGKYSNMNQKCLEALQKHLLAISIFNLKVKKDLIDAILISKKSKELDIVNMFKIETIKVNDNGSKDIRIIFLRNGYFAMQSTFISISEKNLEEIRNILVDNTKHNLVCDAQCKAVTTLDLIAVIDNMLKNKR